MPRDAIIPRDDLDWLGLVVDMDLIELGDRLAKIGRDNHVAAHAEPSLRREALAGNLGLALLELFRLRQYLKGVLDEARPSSAPPELRGHVETAVEDLEG